MSSDALATALAAAGLWLVFAVAVVAGPAHPASSFSLFAGPEKVPHHVLVVRPLSGRPG
jgi:hypothetical protein